MNEFQHEPDDSQPDQRETQWAWTAWIKVGKARWRRLNEKFWRVPREVKWERYAICQDCEEFVPVTTQCRRCLCAMGIKTWYAGFACPEGKWPALSPPADATGEARRDDRG
ncbi:MAG: hypothetical protein WAL83_09100 [Arenicellales bacterium]